MSTITISGYSDDLIEIEGDLRAEWNFFPDDAADSRLIAVSDGTLLRVNYDRDGLWRLTRLVAGSATYNKSDGDMLLDTHDVVTLTGDLHWVVLGMDYEK